MLNIQSQVSFEKNTIENPKSKITKASGLKQPTKISRNYNGIISIKSENLNSRASRLKNKTCTKIFDIENHEPLPKF